MSYTIAKSITIKNDKVFLNAASNNIYPRTFQKFESEYLSSTYQKEGLPGLYKSLAASIRSGDLVLYKGSKITNELIDVTDLLRSKKLTNFLDNERYCNFVANSLTDSNFDRIKEADELNNLKHEKSAVMDIISKNPSSYNYISNKLKVDKDIADYYVKKCSKEWDFSFPAFFNDDKELALYACQQKGCNFRQLDDSLKGDADVILTAFKNGEHLPDLICGPLARDKEFIKQLFDVQPHIHFHRFPPEIREDKDVALKMLNVTPWVSSTFSSLPSSLQNDKDIQQVAFSRSHSPDDINKMIKSLGKTELKPLSCLLEDLDFSYEITTFNPSLDNKLDGKFSLNTNFIEIQEFRNRIASIRECPDVKQSLAENPITLDELKEISKPMLALVDLQGANLGDIQSERYEVYLPNTIENIIDRLDIYIKDYFLDALEEEYMTEAQKYTEMTGKYIDSVDNAVDFIETMNLQEDASYYYSRLNSIKNLDFYLDVGCPCEELTVPFSMRGYDISIEPGASTIIKDDLVYVKLQNTPSLNEGLKNLNKNSAYDTNINLNEAYLAYNPVGNDLYIKNVSFCEDGKEPFLAENLSIPIVGEIKPQLLSSIQDLIEHTTQKSQSLDSLITSAEQSKTPNTHTSHKSVDDLSK